MASDSKPNSDLFQILFRPINDLTKMTMQI